MIKFKIQVFVTGDPGISQEDTGTRHQLLKTYSDTVKSVFLLMERTPEFTSITVTRGSVNYIVSKIPKP